VSADCSPDLGGLAMTQIRTQRRSEDIEAFKAFVKKIEDLFHRRQGEAGGAG
jgi:hypothetical protein